MKLLFVLIPLLCATSGAISAQKATSAPPPDQCRIAFYTRDSIAIQFAEAKPKYEAIKASQSKLNEIRERQIPVTDKLLTAQSDSAKNKTATGKKEIETARTDVKKLQKDSLAEEQNIAKQYELLKPTYAKVDRVADSIGKARGVKQIRESADNSAMVCPTDQMLMIDITNDIAIAMHVKPKLVKIGIYNMDSLMRLMPGYAIIADSIKKDHAAFDAQLAERDRAIALKQRELDSLRPTLSRKKISDREKEIAAMQDERDTYRGYELYKLDISDSLRTNKYRKVFYKALADAHKQYGCYRSNEYARAHADWTTDEAEFIDLNAVVAEKLKTVKPN